MPNKVAPSPDRKAPPDALNLGNEPVNVFKAATAQLGINPQQAQQQDQAIKDLEATDKVKTEAQIKKDQEELERIKKMKKEHHETAEQLGVQSLQSQPQPTGPEILPAKKLEPYAPLTPGKPSGDTIDVKQKRGTREVKKSIGA